MSELLEKHGFHFQKKYGQNFLQDVKIPRRIAAECTEYAEPAGFVPDTCDTPKIPALILEIGPGAGILTGELAKRFEKVVAVEIDRSLEGVLAESLAPYDNAEVVFGDIMETDLNELLTPRRVGQNGNILPVSVCANLPYYITTPILMRLVESFADFDYITVMVQKEVASRLTALPGSAEYGSITASLGLYGVCKRLFAVPSGCFYPRPKVDSAIVRLKLHKPPLYTEKQIKRAGEVIRAGFSMCRKTLANTLAPFTGGDKAKVAEVLRDSLGISETVRGETLSPAQYVALSEALATSEFTKSN